MSTSRTPTGNTNGLLPATANGQLETPALTPISEHGDQGHAPFPNYEDHADESDYGNGKGHGHRTGNGHVGQQEKPSGTRQRGSIGQDIPSQKSSTPASPRTMSAETPKIMKLSPSQIQALTSSPGVALTLRIPIALPITVSYDESFA